MAEIVCDGPLDLAALLRHLAERLPKYAYPVLLRLRPEIDVTATFKQVKNARDFAAFDPSACPDALYVLDPERRAYVELDQSLFARIQSGKMRL